MRTLEHNVPWSRRTDGLRSRRQRERPRSTGDSEENHHFIWHLGPSCVTKQSREHFKSEQGVCITPTLERNAPLSRRTVSLRSPSWRRPAERLDDSVVFFCPAGSASSSRLPFSDKSKLGRRKVASANDPPAADHEPCQHHRAAPVRGALTSGNKRRWSTIAWASKKLAMSGSQGGARNQDGAHGQEPT